MSATGATKAVQHRTTAFVCPSVQRHQQEYVAAMLLSEAAGRRAPSPPPPLFVAPQLRARRRRQPMLIPPARTYSFCPFPRLAACRDARSCRCGQEGLRRRAGVAAEEAKDRRCAQGQAGHAEGQPSSSKQQRARRVCTRRRAASRRSPYRLRLLAARTRPLARLPPSSPPSPPLRWIWMRLRCCALPLARRPPLLACSRRRLRATPRLPWCRRRCVRLPACLLLLVVAVLRGLSALAGPPALLPLSLARSSRHSSSG